MKVFLIILAILAYFAAGFGVVWVINAIVKKVTDGNEYFNPKDYYDRIWAKIIVVAWPLGIIGVIISTILHGFEVILNKVLE